MNATLISRSLYTNEIYLNPTFCGAVNADIISLHEAELEQGYFDNLVKRGLIAQDADYGDYVEALDTHGIDDKQGLCECGVCARCGNWWIPSYNECQYCEYQNAVPTDAYRRWESLLFDDDGLMTLREARIEHLVCSM